MKRRGFTIIELIIAIVIIGILATLLMLNLNKASRKARDARRAGDIAEIQKAVESYVVQYKLPPKTSAYFGDETTNGHMDASYAKKDSATGTAYEADDFMRFLQGSAGPIGNSVNPSNIQFMQKVPVDPTNSSANLTDSCESPGARGYHYCYYFYPPEGTVEGGNTYYGDYYWPGAGRIHYRIGYRQESSGDTSSLVWRFVNYD